MTLSALNDELHACRTPQELDAVMRKFRAESNRQRESRGWEQFIVSNQAPKTPNTLRKKINY
jgi:hypothetical protein